MRYACRAVEVLAWLVLLAAGVMVSTAEAAVKTVSWANPTANTDGSALAASQITRTTVYWGTSATALTNSKAVAGPATSTTVDLAPGTWYVGARTTANGNESALSNIVQVVVPQPTPNPPTITVQEVVAGINMAPAYRVTTTGQRGSTVIGFVPVGTACDGAVVYTYRGKSYRRVSKDSVRWWGTAPTDAVAAACG